MTNNQFEESGNFIYGVSVDEIRKVATALQARHVYYTHLNDFFHPRLSRHEMSSTTPRLISQTAIAVQDLFARARLMSWGSVTIIFFKHEASGPLHAKLTAAGLKRMNIPVNPYIGPPAAAPVEATI